MKHQQAVFLQEMGITRWQVRKPTLFTEQETLKQLNLAACKLLVICTEQDKTHPLMSSIIKAFAVDLDNVVYCSLAQFEHQQGALPPLIWSTVGHVEIASDCQLLHSPSIEQLSLHRDAKKSLWKQFCAYQQ